MSELALSQLTEASVEAISNARHEPAWLREFRVRSFKVFRELPVEQSLLYTKYVDPIDLNFDTINMKLPEAPKTKINEVLKGLESERAITQYQVESTSIQADLPDSLQKEGVIFTDITTALQKHEDIIKRSLAAKAIPPEDDKLAAMNNALFNTGIFLYVPKAIEVTLPFRHVTITDSENSGYFAQNLIIAGNRSKFTVIEEAHSTGQGIQHDAGRSTYSNLTEIHLQEGSEVSFSSINNLGTHINIFSNKKSIGEKDSRIVWSAGFFGGAYIRSRLESVMKAEGSSSENIEVVFGSGSQRFDTVSNITHIGSNTSGHAVSKGVVKDKARSLFKGMIRIGKQAKNSRAYLAEHAMLLGKEARAEAIPGLEIETNEVKATHSASVAQINDEQLFYLMSRGLRGDEAKELIVAGFLEPAVERIPVADIAKRIRRIIELKWMGTYDFKSSLITTEFEDEYPEETQHAGRDIFEGHYKYR